jgi:excisionase family DNA binding protein
MPQQYYTLDQAAQILRINPEQLKEMARKKEIRAFQDRSGWRFRSQEIDEMARERGFGSDPELPLGEAARTKPGDAGGGNEVFNFSLGADESDEVPLGKQPAATEKPSRSGSGSRKPGASKSPTKASSDSDVRLVIEGGGEAKFAADAGSKAPASKGPVSPAPKVGSSKSRKAPVVQDDSGVRIVPLDKPSDSDVKIEPASAHDSGVPMPGKEKTKKASDSDIRIEEVEHSGKVDQNVTEEIDLDAEERKAAEARAKAARRRPKPGSSPSLPTKSPFELSETDIDVNGPAAPERAEADTDSSSDFELKPLKESSSPLELGSDEMPAIKSDDEVSLGEVTGGKGASGINLRDAADSGISLEPGSSDEMDLDLSLEPSRTPKPAPAAKEKTDSSSDFDLNVDEGSSSPTEGSSSEFELSLQEDDASPTEGSSSEFELSLDAEGSDMGAEAAGSDSDSEFELTLDDSGGLSVEQEASSDSDFDVSLNEESGSEAVALDEGETDLESSEFDLSLEGEESGSQVVPLEDEEEFDEGAATVQRKAAGKAAGAEALGEQLDEDLEEAPAAEEEEEVEAVTAPAAAAPPADWGVMVPVVSMLSTVILFIVSLMGFELIQGMWGYHTGNKVSNLIIHPIAKMVSGEDKLPEN